MLGDLGEFVAGRINAHLQRTSAHAARSASEHTVRAVLMESHKEAENASAKSLLEKAQERLKGQPLERKRAEEAEAAIDLRRAELTELPLLVRIQTKRSMMIATMVGTAGSFGALTWLSLQAGSVALILHYLIPIAGAIAAELVLGSLGAEVYDRTPEQRRRQLAMIAMSVIVIILVGTETLAGVARQKGAEETNKALVVNQRTGQAEPPPGDLTPSLWWTAPLSVLVTLSGAGVVGLWRVHMSRNDLHGGVSDAKKRLELARAALIDAERDAERSRNAAAAQSREALRISGEASAARTRSGDLTNELKLLKAEHEAAIKQVIATANIVYRVAAAAERAEGTAPARRRRTHDHRLPLIIGASGMAVAVAADLTTSLPAGLATGSGSMVMIGAGLKRTYG